MSRYDGHKKLIGSLFAPDAQLRRGHPLGDMIGPDALWQRVYRPLPDALPDLERNDFIVMAGPRWGDGFLSLVPTGKRFSRRSLDFWPAEDGKIRENRVMVDMLDLYRQLGVDVFARIYAFIGTNTAA